MFYTSTNSSVYSNPPTDPGRKLLSPRFLRHSAVIYVDYPSTASLQLIYTTFSRAALKNTGNLISYAEPLSEAMVDFYQQSQRQFTPDQHPHYVYSPRELTRWVHGLAEFISSTDVYSIESLLKIWAYEALRLFSDRLVTEKERQWTLSSLETIGQKYFPGVNISKCLSDPLLYTSWISRSFCQVSIDEMREFMREKLKAFCEEEVDTNLVFFDEVLDHVLRIDRAFR